MRGRGRRPVSILAAALATGALAVGVSSALGDEGGENPQPIDFTHNVLDAPAPVAGAVFGNSPGTKTGQAICTTETQTGANANTDCETATAGPHNETSIAVDPNDPDHILGGANDYQLGINPGGHVTETVLSRAHLSFDGGQTWSEYPLYSNSAYQATGDPSVAFDADGHAYYATLGFRFVGPTNATSPDVLVANSGDGGKAWSVARVASGSGNFGSVGDVLDKEYIAAWGSGNVVVVYGDFRQAQKGSFVSAKIYSSVSHDHGSTWSKPQVISGDLDEAFVATPVVSSDGRVFVSFLNTTDLTTGRDDYEFVELDPQTGATIAGPTKVATTIDGFTDYPIALGRQTYQDSIFRSWAAGNIAVDPNDSDHLAVVWSDMRNSTTPAPSNPYAATTNSDVIVSESSDGGANWGPPQAIALAGDQFMPWSAFDSSSALRIGFFDRSYDPANHQYGYTVATFGGASVQATDVLSDPTTGDRWFAATLDPDFPFATSFIGDYSNIAVVPGTTTVLAYWTDLRNDVTFAGRTGHGEDAYFARVG
jgi:BNR repeat-like domain